MSIDEARRVLADLEEKQAAAAAREVELANEGRRLAYAAETGDAAAKKALAKFDEEAFVIDRNRKNRAYAIEEAKRKVAEAEQAAIVAENVEKAKRALAIATSIEARGKKLDEALLALAIEAELLENDLASLNYGLGISHPSIRNFKAVVERPFLAGLMFQPSGKTRSDGQPLEGTLKLRHLAPGERMTFSEITDGYAKTIRRTAGLVLGDKGEEAA